jgi:hypothetical protein
MNLIMKSFGQNKSEAVTVDWVVQTAAVIGLGRVALIPIAYSSGCSAQGISDYLGDITVGYDKQ